MNFEEWFDSQTKIGYPLFLDYESAQLAWEAAKEEVLKAVYIQCAKNGFHGYYNIEARIKEL